MIIHSYRRKLGSVRKLAATCKELPTDAGFKEQAWWTLADWIEETFGDEGGTPEEIYRLVTGPRGLTADTTVELLHRAREGGYLKGASEI